MKKLQRLLTRYTKGAASPEEKEFVEQYYSLFEQEADLNMSESERKQLVDANWEKMENGMNEPQSGKLIYMLATRKRWIAAAVIFLIAGAGWFWYAGTGTNTDNPVQTATAEDIAPGRNGAILTLDNGKEILLDSSGSGVIATQHGSKVILNDNGVAYAPEEKPSSAIVYNTLSTPRGRQFHIDLPDGTSVWLNAASSIRFPASFSGKERKVYITGEAYFEVTANKSMPFVVDVNGKAEVQVLGTVFNVNAYEDGNAIYTSLLQGSIRMKHQQTSVTLLPGQQTLISSKGMELVPHADTEMAVAWKNGKFQFSFTPIDEILRQLARWYDVDVIYERGVPDLAFTGMLRRDYTLKQALSILETMGVHFRTEGRKLIVLP